MPAPSLQKPYPWSKAPGRFYRFACLPWKFIFGCTMNIRTHGTEQLDIEGGALFAVNHLGHLDPVIVTVLTKRRISWISRKEFFKYCFMRWFLQATGAFQVDRAGPALPTMREGLKRLRRGEIIGIFPEGEVVTGGASVLLGGPIKRGVCLLSSRSGRPIVPVIVLGGDRLSQLGPWLPAKRGRLWIYVGQPVHPPENCRGRMGRIAFSKELEVTFQSLFQEACAHFKLSRDIVPCSAKADHILDKLPPQEKQAAPGV